MVDDLDKAGPMVPLLPYQREALACEHRFTWNCWSRQTGKSFTFSLKCVLRALERRRHQVILSAGERQSVEVMHKVRMHCQALKAACAFHGHDIFRHSGFQRLEAHLPGGVRIIALPANPMTARGFSGDVFLDEFAMHADDAEIWSALFPTLMRGEGRLDVASTPRGQNNLFHRLRANPQFHQRTLTIHDAVRQGLDVDVSRLRAAIADEQAWRQEFECAFVDEATAFLPHTLIRSCQDSQAGTVVDRAVLDRPQAEVFIGIDVGRVRDLTVIWLWERRGEELVTIGVETKSAVAFSEQEAAIAEWLGYRAVRRCCIDATGLGRHLAESLVERFGEHRVEPIVFTAAVKSQLAGGLRVLAERGRLRIPADREIADDWHTIERIVTRAGHVRFDAARTRDGHADRFWAAALGIHAADGHAGAVECATDHPLTFARRGIW